MNMKKIFFMLFCFLMTTTIYSQETWEALGHLVSENGFISPNTWWKLEDGVLMIKGKGNMPKFQNPCSTTLGISTSIGIGTNSYVSVSPSVTTPSLPIVPWNSKCSSITSVLIEDGITNIGDGVFYECKNLTSITIPESVTYIGACAFGQCKNLTSIIIPEKVLSIGSSAFLDCKNLEIVEGKCPVPPKTGTKAFGPSIKKAKLIVPVGAKAIYATTKVWKDFGIIEETSVPTTKKWIPEGSLSSNITWRIENDTLFMSGKGVMPDMVVAGSSALWDNFRDYFTSIVIGNGITRIGKYIFSSHKNIHSIIIAESVTSMGDFPFLRCKNLRIVEIKRDIPFEIGMFAFEPSLTSKAKLIVPAGSKSQYETDKRWSEFRTIEEKEIVTETGEKNSQSTTEENSTITITEKEIQSAPIETLPKPCVIHLKRTKNFVGAARKVQVFLNGIEQEILKNNQTIVMQTDRVKNELQIQQDNRVSAILRFDATIGGEIHIDYYYLDGYMKIIENTE